MNIGSKIFHSYLCWRGRGYRRRELPPCEEQGVFLPRDLDFDIN